MSKRKFLFMALMIAPMMTGTRADGQQQIAAGVTTRVVLNQLYSSLSEIIDKATNSSNFLLARAAMQGKDVIDLWRKSNSGLLDQAFSGIDKVNQDLFSNLRQSIDTARTGIDGSLETAREIVETSNNITENLPFAKGSTFLLRYGPHIVPPEEIEKVILVIRGVNLDKGNPQLALSKGAAERQSLNSIEARFKIPIGELIREPKKIHENVFELSYTVPSSNAIFKIFGKREMVFREIAIASLPADIGTYSVDNSQERSNKIVEVFTQDLGEFKGSNERQSKVAVPREGWKWNVSDRSQFRFEEYAGDNGRCEFIDFNQSSENGIAMVARLDRKGISFKYPNGAPGVVNCRVIGPVYRTETVSALGPILTGTVPWVRDTVIKLPDNTITYSAKLTLFDGRERTIESVAGIDRYFTFNKINNTLVITPITPKDIISW